MYVHVYTMYMYMYITRPAIIHTCVHNHINYIPKLGRIQVHGKSHTVLSKDTVTSEANLVSHN